MRKTSSGYVLTLNGAIIVGPAELPELAAQRKPRGKTHMSKTEEKLHHLRNELEVLRARYDSGAVSNATYAANKSLEREIAWTEHYRAMRKEAA